MNIWKKWHLMILIVLVVGSLLAISPKLGVRGVEVSFVERNSSAFGILEKGDVIRQINGEAVNSPEEFQKFVGLLNVSVQTKEKESRVGSLQGVEVVDPSSSRIKLGLELVGGTRVVLQPETNVSSETIDQIISTLQLRINSFGLKDFKFQKIQDLNGQFFIQAELAGGTEAEVRDLLEKEGKFEGKIPLFIAPSGNGTYTLQIDSAHPFSATATEATIEGKTLRVNSTDRIEIEGIAFEYSGLDGTRAILRAIVYTGLDIQSVYSDPQSSGIRALQDGYEFYFTLLISEEGANRFAKVTKNIPADVSNRGYLQSKLEIYIDDQLINTYSIAESLRGQVVRNPSVSGFRQTQSEAAEEKLYSESLLRSGSLPVKLQVVRSDSISPSLGKEFVRSVLIAAGAALFAVFSVVLLRYRNLKISLLMIATNIAEIIIVLGAMAVINFNIDLAAIGAMIAVIGSGVDHLIIITDEGKRKESIALKQKIKRAFGIIMAVGATVIAAMLPLFVIGLGMIKSFAIVTTIGILVGILITRPAYAELYEMLIGEQLVETKPAWISKLTSFISGRDKPHQQDKEPTSSNE